MYCYEKPRTEDKTHMRKSFSLSTRTALAAASHQSLLGVVQRRFVGWDSEESTDSLQSKTGSLSGYSMNDIRIRYSPSESAHSGIHVNGNSRLERKAIDMEDKGSDLSGTVQLCAKPATGQPCIQCQLPDKKIKTVLNGLKKANVNDNDIQDHVLLGKIIIQYIKKAGCNSWEWKDVEAIAGMLCWNVEPETKLEDEPTKPESKSLDGYEVSFDVGSFECDEKFRKLVKAQPFEGGFTAKEDDQKYYHVFGKLRTTGDGEKVKPIWQTSSQNKRGEVKVKIVGLYEHKRNNNKVYSLVEGCSDAPETLTIKP